MCEGWLLIYQKIGASEEGHTRDTRLISSLQTYRDTRLHTTKPGRGEKQAVSPKFIPDVAV